MHVLINVCRKEKWVCIYVYSYVNTNQYTHIYRHIYGWANICTHAYTPCSLFFTQTAMQCAWMADLGTSVTFPAVQQVYESQTPQLILLGSIWEGRWHSAHNLAAANPASSLQKPLCSSKLTHPKPIIETMTIHWLCFLGSSGTLQPLGRGGWKISYEKSASVNDLRKTNWVITHEPTQP